MSRSDVAIRDAEKLARALTREGRKFDAEVIRRVVRSLRTARTTASVLHKEAMELRRWSPEDNG